MLAKSPSGALSPYYYKGGYFHGIHYGSYFDDAEAFLSMMEQEETFLLNSPQKRRVLMDFYETDLTEPILEKVIRHMERIRPRIIKLAVAADKRSLRRLRKALTKAGVLSPERCYFCTDMEEGKTWLVSDEYV